MIFKRFYRRRIACACRIMQAGIGEKVQGKITFPCI